MPRLPQRRVAGGESSRTEVRALANRVTGWMLAAQARLGMPGEARVLRYLPANLSRPEIAGELSVSPNTVNTHVRSIYAKLQVRDRSARITGIG